jgi:alkaline phosphatase D
MRYFPYLFPILSGLLLLLGVQSNAQDITQIEQLERLAFGSCNDEDDPQDYWKNIASNAPQLWIWMGDNIYGDTEDMALLQSKYDRQKMDSHYNSFIEKVPVIGTWDDHDYGVNDGNKLYPAKEESKKLMLEFLDVSPDNEVWSRPGVYQSYTIGKKNKVKIILLDTRSFQDELKDNPTRDSRYIMSEGDILGEAQWGWLEDELLSSDAAVNIIVSSIQFLASDHKYEKWANFPYAKKRMFDILRAQPDKKCLFLSGDRHIAEISKRDLRGLNYPLYDITSSGLTHSYEESREYNSHRLGQLITRRNYGFLELDWTDAGLFLQITLYSTSGKTLEKLALGKF